MIIDKHGNCLHEHATTTLSRSSGATSYAQICDDCGVHVAGFLADDSARPPVDYECPICGGVGCEHCGSGEVDPSELAADTEFDDHNDDAGDEWDRARDRAIDMAVGVW
ncbi:hypothetical protein [Nocardia cyriacigeorgica]|uniref:hypothetical protein n=1 Tax=Nocardia cyriacigeorgica TaxID=135487 RepID=UPI0024560A23|nr:hypothetical protein [Nocardia cyriacigeorgica]